MKSKGGGAVMVKGGTCHTLWTRSRDRETEGLPTHLCPSSYWNPINKGNEVTQRSNDTWL